QRSQDAEKFQQVQAAALAEVERRWASHKESLEAEIGQARRLLAQARQDHAAEVERLRHEVAAREARRVQGWREIAGQLVTAVVELEQHLHRRHQLELTLAQKERDLEAAH